MKNLNPHTELHKIFGKSVTGNTFNKKLDPRMKSLYPRSYFVQPQIGSWHPCQNLSMTMVKEETDGYFRYVHSKSYQDYEKQFRLAIELHTDQAFVNILGEKPYHTNTLLTLADHYRSQSDYVTERDYIEKCLYALETATDASMRWGSSKLDYR